MEQVFGPTNKDLTTEEIVLKANRIRQMARPESYPNWGFGGGSGMEMKAQDAWEAKYAKDLRIIRDALIRLGFENIPHDPGLLLEKLKENLT